MILRRNIDDEADESELQASLQAVLKTSLSENQNPATFLARHGSRRKCLMPGQAATPAACS
jgi:hypothetical protein